MPAPNQPASPRQGRRGARWQAPALGALIAVPVLLAAGPPPSRSNVELLRARGQMVDDLSERIQHERTIAAMRQVPRHLFVPRAAWPAAYENRPLAIGHGQTISQPEIVALMTSLADPQPTDRVLEIGTGSGYQAAVLSLVVGHVYSIEIVEELASTAQKRLQRLGYTNITVRSGDGYRGWPEEAPFDAVVVTAAPDHVPKALLVQLKLGGRLVMPLGPTDDTQDLVVITRTKDGFVREVVTAVRFVPMTGEAQRR